MCSTLLAGVTRCAERFEMANRVDVDVFELVGDDVAAAAELFDRVEIAVGR